jgi:hypothetical protein
MHAARPVAIAAASAIWPSRFARITAERHFSPWRDSIVDDWVEMSEMSPRERYDRYNHPWEERLVGKEYICIYVYK